MSLYGVLRSGVSGMNAQSNKLGTVAENVQNSATTGYKRASTEFQSLILDSGEGNYNPGGVQTKIRYAIGDQGAINYTSSDSDLAISGNGFFVVSDPGGTPYLTRAGNFVIDGPTGNLRNSAGFTLMGYSLANGPATPALNSLNGMVPVSIKSLGMQANASTQGTFVGNLPYNGSVGTTTTGVATPAAGAVPGYVEMSVAGVSAADQITFTVGGTTHTFEAPASTTDVNSLVNAINSDPASSALVTASNVGGNLRLTATTPTGVTGSFTDFTGEGFKKSSLQTFDNVGNSVKLDIYMTKTGTNSWDVSIANGDNVLSGPTTMSFDGNGQLIGPKSVTFGIPNGKPFTLDMSGMTQLAGDYDVKGTANGNAPSAVKDAEFAPDGTVYAVYEDGTRVAAYRVPLATVPSPDNLHPLAGNVFEATAESGNYQVGFPETGAFGTLTSGALEASNVDIGTELTSMIEAQTAYTANSKVFQTGSELLDVLMNLKR